MTSYLLAGIGELLWDVLPGGEVLGGAPVNFAYHASALGATGIPISTVGLDLRGDRALEQLRERGLQTAAISRIQMPTGFVEVTVDVAGVARYFFPQEVAWDHLRINDYAAGLQGRLDAVCFGTLGQRSAHAREVIGRFLDGLPEKTLRVFDVNLRQHFYDKEVLLSSLQQCDILKLSNDELPEIAALLGLATEPERVLAEILDRYDLTMVVYTRGDRGSLLLTATQCDEHPGVSAQVVDTIGAGDCFTAAATIGYLQGLSLADINRRANRLAAYVCSQQGAMPTLPSELRLVLSAANPSS
jgi:fructokinase